MADSGHLATAQAAWMAKQDGMFLHFGLETFTGGDSSNNTFSPSLFQPTALDVDQWLDLVVDAGMKYAVLTAYHVAEFALWDAQVTPYAGALRKCTTVTKPGGGTYPDIVALFTAGCHARGLGCGLYHVVTASSTAFKTMLQAHLTELLTNYGTIDVVWIDYGGVSGGQALSESWFADLNTTVNALQPDCLVFSNNEEQNTTYTQYIGLETPTWYNGQGIYLSNTSPVEFYSTIQAVVSGGITAPKWFYNANSPEPLRTQSYITGERALAVQSRANSTGAGAGFNYLLDVPPDGTGIINASMEALLLATYKPTRDLARGATTAITASSRYNTNSSINGAGGATYGPQKLTNSLFANPLNEGISADGDTAPYVEMNLGTMTPIDTVCAYTTAPNTDALRAADLTVAVFDASHTLVYRSPVFNAGGNTWTLVTRIPGVADFVIPSGIVGQYVRIERNQAGASAPYAHGGESYPYMTLAGFSVFGGGVQWQKRSVGGHYVDISGQTQASLAVAAPGVFVREKVTNQAGSVSFVPIGKQAAARSSLHPWLP